MSDDDKETSTKDIFTKLAHANERDSLMQDLVKLRGELRCKAPNQEEMIRLEAHRWEPKALVCGLMPNTPPPTGLPQSVVTTFSVGAERYFLTAPLSETNGGFYSLATTVDIFQLQRRQSYRIRIPESYNSCLEIKAVNGKPFSYKGMIQDISTGGCRAFLKSDKPVLHTDDIIEGILMVGHRPMFPFKGKARHIRVDLKPHPQQVLGVEFIEITAAMESKLFSLTMELHRELFSRWTDR
jgi:hypothetical protein